MSERERASRNGEAYPVTEQYAQTGVLVKDGGWQFERQDWVPAGKVRELERRLDEMIEGWAAQSTRAERAEARINELESAQSEIGAIPDWMVIDAFRYCVGRQTYQVGVTCRWLVENWTRIAPNAKEVIRSELEAAFADDDRRRSSGLLYGTESRLGSDIDRLEWKAVLTLARCSLADHHDGANDGTLPTSCGGQMTQPIPDFLVLAPTLAAKLAAVVVHADEFTGPGGRHFDMAAIRSLVADPEVRDWIDRCGPLAPRKRS